MLSTIPLEFYTAVAKAFNNFDILHIKSLLSDDVTLCITREIELVSGKKNVLEYLNKKFESLKESKSTNFAELSIMGNQHGHRQVIEGVEEGDLCLRFANGPLKPHGAILVLEWNQVNITDICMCTLVHEWSAVVGSGKFPF